MTRPLTGQIALVTGASRGIGAAVAERLASAGAHVLIAARTVADLEKVDDRIRAVGGKATIVPLDLRQAESISQLGATLYERFGRLDIFVGNAGMLGDLMPLAHLTQKIWDDVMNVNVTANWRLIQSLDPLLRKSEAARAMFVTSGVTRGVFPYWGPYAMSKAALETMVLTYAAEVAHTKLRVNLVDPGVVRTKMRATAFPGEDPETLATPESIAGAFLALALPSCVRHGERVNVWEYEEDQADSASAGGKSSSARGR